MYNKNYLFRRYSTTGTFYNILFAFLKKKRELFIYLKSISINKFGFIFKNNLYLTDFDFGSRMCKRSNDQHGINLIGC